MIRNRRLGDAPTNILNTIGPTQAASPVVVGYITASLQSQGLDPAAASSAQVQKAMNDFLTHQSLMNPYPTFPGEAPPQLPGPAPGPQLPYTPPGPPATGPNPGTILIVSPTPAPPAAGFSLSSIPWYAWAGAAALLLFGSGK